MILGTGLDLLDTARFKRVAARHGAGFVEGLFSAAERAWCARQRRPDRAPGAASATRPGGRAASLVLRGAVSAEAERQGVRRIHLALATTRAIAAASVILER